MDVEELKVFRLAYDLSLDVHRASLSWPRVEQYGGVADQVRRASKSVCALLVEGGGRLRNSRGEFSRYLVMAVGSADEARLWCRYADATWVMPMRPPRSGGAPALPRRRGCCKD